MFVLVAVYDRVAEVFSPVVTERNETSAMRSFGDSLRSGESSLAAHPDDYDLVLCGRYDETCGRVEVLEHRILCNAGALLRQIRGEVAGAELVSELEGQVNVS